VNEQRDNASACRSEVANGRTVWSTDLKPTVFLNRARDPVVTWTLNLLPRLGLNDPSCSLLGVPLISGEFAIGVTNSRALRRFFRGYAPMPLGREDAVYAGQSEARLAFEMGENVLWIAGTALRHGLTLVTRDRMFSRVPGLKVKPY